MYFDADVLYALIKENDYHKDYAKKVASSTGRKTTSVMTLLELEIVIKRELGDALSLETAGLVEKAVPGIQVLPFTEEQFGESTRLRARYGLGIFDAAHAAICLDKRQEIASTDEVYKRIPGLKTVQ